MAHMSNVDKLGAGFIELIMEIEPDVTRADPEAVHTVIMALSITLAGVLSGVTMKVGEGAALAVTRIFAEQTNKSVFNITGMTEKLLEEKTTTTLN